MLNSPVYDRLQYTGRNARFDNEDLSQIRSDVRDVYKELLKQEEIVTPQMVKDSYSADDQSKYITLVSVFEKWVENELLRKDIIERTKEVKINHLRRLKRFLEYSNQKGILIANVRPKFAYDYIKWQLNVANSGKSHTKRTLNALKSVMEDAVNQEIIAANPIAEITQKGDKPKSAVFLSPSELKALELYKFDSPTLQKVADFFLFQCYTGMSYSELKSFDYEKEIFNINGQKWIRKYRPKAKSHFQLPLYPKLQKLLAKYDNHLPVITNGRYNIYIKDVALILNIDKHFTTHVGRKTAAILGHFAGLSMETVQKLMGHKFITTTQLFYATNSLHSEKVTSELGSMNGFAEFVKDAA